MQERSTFVTVVGWIFMVLTGLGMLYSLAFMFLPMDKIMTQAQLQASAPPGQAAPDPAMMKSFLRGMFFFIFVVQTWVLLSSIGLVMRKGWARISFIVVCALDTFFSLIYVLVGLLGRSVPLNQAPNTTPAMADLVHSMMSVVAVLGAVFAAFFIFIIYKLNTQKVIQEFLPQPRP